MLPPQAVSSMIQGGGSPSSLFQQDPLQQNQTPMSPSFDPSLAGQQLPPTAQQPVPGQPGQQPMPPVAPDGQSPAPEMSEAQMILQALTDRLAHHSKITQKTVNTLTDMISANQQIAGQPQV